MIDIRKSRLLEHLQAQANQLHEFCDEQDVAITELAAIIAQDEENSENIEQAVIELAEIIGGAND